MERKYVVVGQNMGLSQGFEMTSRAGVCPRVVRPENGQSSRAGAPEWNNW